MSLVDRILNTINNSSDVQEKINSNSVTKSYWETIKSGNNRAGEELAYRILSNYGLSKEKGIRQAQQGLQAMFGEK